MKLTLGGLVLLQTLLSQNPVSLDELHARFINAILELNASLLNVSDEGSADNRQGNLQTIAETRTQIEQLLLIAPTSKHLTNYKSEFANWCKLASQLEKATQFHWEFRNDFTPTGIGSGGSESVNSAVEDFMKALKQLDVKSLEEMLPSDFTYKGQNRAAFLDTIKQLPDTEEIQIEYDPEKMSQDASTASLPEIKIEGDFGSAEVNLNLRKFDEKWQVDSVAEAGGSSF